MFTGSGRWRRFRTKGGAVRFDVLANRFIRIRCREFDTPAERAYVVIDIVTLRVTETQLVPKATENKEL